MPAVPPGIEVEVKNALSPEMQVVFDCREAVRKAQEEVDERQSALKEAKATLEACQDGLNVAIDEMFNAARQPKLFTASDGEITVNTPPPANAHQSGESQAAAPRQVTTTLVCGNEDAPDVAASGGVLALPPAKLTAKSAESESDHTTAYEKRLLEENCPFPQACVQNIQEQIAEFRDSQASLAPEQPKPKWGFWREFDVNLADGSIVEVLYKPDWMNRDNADHFEFWGHVGEGGYREHLEVFEHKRPSVVPLAEYARELAQKFHDEWARKQKGGSKRGSKRATA